MVLQEGGYHVPTIGDNVRTWLAAWTAPPRPDRPVAGSSGGAAAPRPPRPGGQSTRPRWPARRGAGRRTARNSGDEGLDPGDERPSPGARAQRVVEVGPAGGQHGHDGLGHTVQRVGTRRRRLGLDLPVVLGRHLLNNSAPGRRVAGRDKLGSQPTARRRRAGTRTEQCHRADVGRRLSGLGSTRRRS